MNSFDEIHRRIDQSPAVRLAEVYAPESIESTRNELRRLLTAFGRHFPGDSSVAIVRAPGRVNIIGEHTDYNGYPVLPMALQFDMKIACSQRADERVELRNMDSRFDSACFSASPAIPKSKQGAWENYVKAAVQGILESDLLKGKEVHGFNAVFSGSVPESAGLSSSSALTVASALTFLRINNVDVDRLQLAELVAHAERYAGLEGGGMDQAISLLGKPGHALKIDFFPLRAREVPIPSGVTFVICNSLVRAAKTDTARDAYNMRVAECKLATALLDRALIMEHGKQHSPKFLRDLSPESVGLTYEQLADTALRTMTGNPLTLKQVAGKLGFDIEQVVQKYCTTKGGTIIEEPHGGFSVWKRYRHVTSEARRVAQAVDALESGDVRRLGDLMNQSHESCRDDYEVSCPELEHLVRVARRHGALGARLTGAGFGGCTVNLVPDQLVASFMKGVSKDFYEPLKDVPDNAMFATRPAGAASILFD